MDNGREDAARRASKRAAQGLEELEIACFRFPITDSLLIRKTKDVS